MTTEVNIAVTKKMVFSLGKAHGYLKRHAVQRMYEQGFGHGLGEAAPDPGIQASVSTAFIDELMTGFDAGVAEYEGTL